MSFSFQMFLSEQTDSMSFLGRLANFLNKVFARTLMYHHTSVCDGAIRRHIKVYSTFGNSNLKDFVRKMLMWETAFKLEIKFLDGF